MYALEGFFIKVCLDTQPYSSKPTNPKIITKRIASSVIDIKIQDLAIQLVQPHGRTFIPAWFKSDEKGNYSRTNESWAGQQLFCIDIDGGINLEGAL
ncbi:MAG: hypothetical protein ACYDG2_15915, partial [Ruminiclostridium sp.]